MLIIYWILIDTLFIFYISTADSEALGDSADIVTGNTYRLMFSDVHVL